MPYVEDDLKNLFSGKKIETAQDVSEYWFDSVNSIITEDDTITLHQIVVRERDRGVGSAFMSDLCAYADRVGKPIILEPSEDLGGDLDRLLRFYSRFGFVQDGKYMRREPQ